MNEFDHLTLTEVAEVMKVSRRTILNYRVVGHPLYSKGFHVGRQVMFRRSDVEEYLERCANARA
ncbi:helix-turn-helix domain-containing protein [Gordonia bronchialis]|uniref:helix-turn-helix transcriptional regulator n=1 Tax=Gordonia bronchialis TaxID=2054 RepID=UPI001CBAFB5A|nr:helix-turn-helix domain-containing protein [Gordonia bronchialis]UAK38345.1 helix-turn-helix domain-containing protein [Gordonia bronchialis]